VGEFYTPATEVLEIPLADQGDKYGKNARKKNNNISRRACRAHEDGGLLLQTRLP
jgi:hypothetical protein